VVIFAETDGSREFLLLKRIESEGGFWQSVTGSLEDEETHLEAAVREVREETGITVSADDLIDLQLLNTFEIAPQWQARYAPGVTHNEEVCFAIRVVKSSVHIDSIEHDDWAWVSYARAMKVLNWESSRRALARIAGMCD
jgi:dATP pyrophosphohydrolase